MTWQVILRVDEQAYTQEVVQRAAYSIAREVVVEIQVQGQLTTLLITPNPTSAKATALSPEQVRSLVLQQLNDFALREKIRHETTGIREALIRAAMAGCS